MCDGFLQERGQL